MPVDVGEEAYTAMLKFSLRTLVIGTLVLPPLFAAGYYTLKATGLPTPLFLGIALALFLVSMRIALRGEF
jgi:hypothetical protein